MFARESVPYFTALPTPWLGKQYELEIQMCGSLRVFSACYSFQPQSECVCGGGIIVIPVATGAAAQICCTKWKRRRVLCGFLC